MLFVPPPINPPEAPAPLTQVVALPASFHHNQLTASELPVWSLKGNPKALLDDQSFQLPKTRQP